MKELNKRENNLSEIKSLEFERRITNMTKLNDYMNDGACTSARAVLPLLLGMTSSGAIEASWDKDNKGEYTSFIEVDRWGNGREQGYIASLKVNDKQLNIAFFEHRNSDEICSVRWEQVSEETITIDTAEFGDVYKTKYDVTYSVDYKSHYDMAKWIFTEFTNFYKIQCLDKFLDKLCLDKFQDKLESPEYTPEYHYLMALISEDVDSDEVTFLEHTVIKATSRKEALEIYGRVVIDYYSHSNWVCLAEKLGDDIADINIVDYRSTYAEVKLLETV